MATKYYGINDKWTDDDIENVIEVTSEDGSVDSVKVNGVEYGGGGGGDLSIAEVTIINTNSGYFCSLYSTVFIDDDHISADAKRIYGETAIDVVTYQNNAILMLDDFDSDVDPVCTGGCTWDSDEWYFIITGPGTITVKGVGSDI